MRSFIAAAALVVWASPLLAATMMPVKPFPGAKDTIAAAINDNNVLAGSYLDTSDVKHAFVGSLDGDYEGFDFGGGGHTVATGIDKDGNVTGTNYVAETDICHAKPYERSPKGKLKQIKKDAEVMTGFAWGMSAKGGFVGFRCNEAQFVVGYQGRKGKYTNDVTISGNQFIVAPLAINSSGVIAGWSDELGNPIKGFILKNGTTTFVTYPQAKYTQIVGLNDAGIAAGVWTDDNSVQHAFMYDTNTAQFTSLEPKGARTSAAGGVNSKGLIAIYSDKGSFVYCPKKCPKAN